MTSANALAASPPPSPLTLRTVLAAWRGIGATELRATFLLGYGLTIYHRIVDINRDQLADYASTFLIYLTADQVAAFAMLLAVVVADRVTGKDPDRRRAYLLSVLVGAAAAAILQSLAFQWLGRFAWELGGSTWSADLERRVTFGFNFALRNFFELLMLGGATVWVIVDRRRVRLARARMQAAELERIAAEKRSIESDLQAMQARIEPQFLFNTLAQVRDLFDVNKAQSELMLDELIAYLRAAMPRMRDTSSTVGQEIELVRAYMGVVRLRMGERLAFEIEIPKQLAEARIPPMTLLPLVDHAIARGLGEPQTIASIRIRTGIADGKVRLEIAHNGVGFLPETEGDTIAGIRERLAALYGDAARLELRRIGATVSTASLEIPYQSTPRHESADST